MFRRQREGSVICTSCGVLVGVNDDTCYSCGRWNPGLWGYGPALRRLGNDLGFVPLVEKDYFLACLADVLEHPAVQGLRRVLSGARWQQALRDETGYAVAEAPGAVLSLTRALPWWALRPRQA